MICSDKCRQAARGSEYRKAREPALRRDDYVCTDCGLDDHLECHHKRPVSLGGGHDLTNLQTLCRKCHQAVHRKWRINGYPGHTGIETKDNEGYYYAA